MWENSLTWLFVIKYQPVPINYYTEQVINIFAFYHRNYWKLIILSISLTWFFDNSSSPSPPK